MVLFILIKLGQKYQSQEIAFDTLLLFLGPLHNFPQQCYWYLQSEFILSW